MKNKENFWCELFGHKIVGSSYPNPPRYSRYFIAEGGGVDGIGRQHINLFAECDRCQNKVRFGYIHGTEEGNIL